MYTSKTFDLGRNALKYIIKTHNIKELHIPYYLCDAIRHSLIEEGCKPVFYHIDINFYPIKKFNKNDYILYPNYWGICGKNVQKLTMEYPYLIVDNAHAFFDKPSGFASFNAGHKFGYKESFAYIQCSDNGISYLIKSVPQERQNLFYELHEKYKDINLLKIDLSSAPFCYPCLLNTIEEADKLVSKLKSEGKTIYRYWNQLPESYPEYAFYSRLVPIPLE